MVEKEEETMGSCSNRYSDEMMMLKASVEKDKKERSSYRSSSTVSSRSVSFIQVFFLTGTPLKVLNVKFTYRKNL